MNNECNNIRKAVQSIQLSTEEKASMKASIISGAIPSPMSPVTKSIPSRLYYQWGIGNYGNFIIKHNNFMAALLIAIMLAVGGGSSVMAEKALPGDALYQMKVSVNEPVVALLTLSNEGKVVWQEKLVERRLEEIQKVIAQGTLSSSTQAEIQARVNSQIDTFTAGAKDLSGDKDKAVVSSELTIRLESALKAHQDILEKAVADGTVATDTKARTQELLSSLKENESQVKSDREEMETHLGDTTNNGNASSTPAVAAENKQAVAEKILDNVKTKYQEEKVGLATSTRNQIEEGLSSAEKMLAEGKAAVALSKFGDAREKFQAVIRLANDTRVDILTGSITGDIEDASNNDHQGDTKTEGGNNKKATSSERNNEKRDSKTSASSTVKSNEGETHNDSTSSKEKSEDNKNENNEGVLKVENKNSVKVESVDGTENGSSTNSEGKSEGKVEVETNLKVTN